MSEAIGSLGVLSRREPPPLDTAGRPTGRAYFNVRLVDADSALGAATATLEPRGDSVAVFAVRFEWIGTLTKRPDSVRHALAERAITMATQVGTRCATLPTAPPTCRQFGKGAPADGQCVGTAQ